MTKSKQREDVVFDPPPAPPLFDAKDPDAEESNVETMNLDEIMSELAGDQERDEARFELAKRLVKWIDSTDTLKQRVITEVLQTTQELWDDLVGSFDDLEEDDEEIAA